MKYKIVYGEDARELEENVNALIGPRKGWEPTGGVCVTKVHRTWEDHRSGYTIDCVEDELCQAMVNKLEVG